MRGLEEFQSVWRIGDGEGKRRIAARTSWDVLFEIHSNFPSEVGDIGRRRREVLFDGDVELDGVRVSVGVGNGICGCVDTVCTWDAGDLARRRCEAQPWRQVRSCVCQRTVSAGARIQSLVEPGVLFCGVVGDIRRRRSQIRVADDKVDGTGYYFNVR